MTAHVRWWSSPTSWEDLLTDLCQEAADVGANAIIDLSIGDLSSSWTLGPVGIGANVRHLTGVAVRLE